MVLGLYLWFCQLNVTIPSITRIFWMTLGKVVCTRPTGEKKKIISEEGYLFTVEKQGTSNVF